ncbi:MAG: class I SAM-dependent methyltransferase [Xanthomonadales bacterium]|nr:class I SAM-dependent methyltransferase [Gammaproteobacteria bacterium]NNE05637.1 class I SAM-dependent methyltransferase [Xanthomonadales bacterium]NNL95562.1 class I SAM-dependent methyltransferase [Xanthomonadales bacterium]
MKSKLDFTGERFTPECEREIWHEHMHRYTFAREFCSSRVVLDAACGEGFGTALLSQVASHVTGVDISETAITHARSRYGEANNVAFEVADCCALPFGDRHFDVVVSFETLEHLENQQQLLSEFRRVLRDDGLLILSSPDKAEYSDKQDFDNPFHVRELYRHELESLLAAHFPAFRLLGQVLAFHSVIFDESPAAQARSHVLNQKGELTEGRVAQAPVYLIALCAANESSLPETRGSVWLFDDDQSSVYRHYHHEIRKNMAAGGVLAEKQAEIDRLKARLEQAPVSWWQSWFKRR